MNRVGESDVVRLGVTVQFGLLAGPLLSMIDSSVVNVAVVRIADDFTAGLPATQWIVSGYLLALGVGLSLTPFLARRLGVKTLYLCGMVGFTLASSACAFAPALAFLIAARVVQGLCGAALVPLAMSMLLGEGKGTRSVSPLAGILLFAAPAFGPSLGGLLIAAGGWRWIFLINVPIGVLAALAASRIPSTIAAAKQPGSRFDLPGFVLLAGGLVALLGGVDAGGDLGWGDGRSWALLACGVLLLGGYWWLASRRSDPVIGLAALRKRGPATSILLCAFASVSTYSALLLVPSFAQTVQGHTPLETGLAMLPAGILTGLGASLGGRVHKVIGVTATVLIGFALLAVSTLLLLTITATTPLAITALILTGRSAAIGLISSPLLYAMTSELREDQTTDANSLFNIVQRVTGSLGVALVAAYYAAKAVTVGPVEALHEVGIVLTAVTAVALVLAVVLRAPGRTGAPPMGGR